VIGAPRSGTTILRNTLALHDALWHLPGESHEVLEGPCHPARSGYSSNRVISVPEDVAEGLRTNFFRRSINLNSVFDDPARVLSARTLAERSAAKISLRIADRRGRGRRPDRIRFIEKTPKNVLRVPLMAQLFPDAYWIYVTRRAEPNIASLAEGWHAVERVGPFTRPRFVNSAYPLTHSLDLADYGDRWWKFALPPGWEELRGASVADVAAWQYVQCNQIALDDLRSLDRPVRHVRHEDFICDPVAVTRDLFEWAQLEPSPAAERFAAALPRVNATTKQSGAADRRARIHALIDRSREIHALEAELGYPTDDARGSDDRRGHPTGKDKLLYVAGYGRSGSTALATILSGHPLIVGVGESTFLADDWDDPERPCSCGASYPECDFWGDLALTPGEAEHARQVVRDVDRHVLRTLLRCGRPAWSATAGDYRRHVNKVHTYVRCRSGRPIVLDASKSARGASVRAIALQRLAGENVHLVHLVRDGLASVDSMVTTGSNWAIEGHAPVRRLRTARASVGWLRANLCAVAARVVLGRGRSVQLNYEEVLGDPAAALERVGDLLGIEFATVASDVELRRSFPVGHVVGGNRIRMRGQLELWPRPASEVRLGVGGRVTFHLIAGWMQWALRRTAPTPTPPSRDTRAAPRVSAPLARLPRRSRSPLGTPRPLAPTRSTA
jgi:hypothetical protein